MPTLIVPGSAEWLRMMTSSKVAAVLGLSPYESRFSLWHRMSGQIPAQPDSDVLRRGHYLEPAIVAWFQDQHPEFVVTHAGTWMHPADARWAASPDRMVYSTATGSRCLEVKTSADDTEWGPAGTDVIPAGYRAQVVWEMDCTGARACHVAVLTAFLEFREYLVTYDPAEAEWIRAQVTAFMDSLPDGANPQRPNIDSHDQTYQALRQLNPGIDGTDVDLDPTLARDYCQARTALDAAKAQEALTKALVLDAIGTAKRGRYLEMTIAQRQAKTGGTPYLVAGRNLPNFQET